MAIDRKRNGGFTLFELAIAVGLCTFIILAMYAVVATGRRTWMTGEAMVSAQESARTGLARITRELHHSADIHVEVTNTAAPFADAVDSVTFDIPFDADGDGFLDLVPGTSAIVYGADDAEDFDTDGDFWEAGWKIEFRLNAANEQIVRRVLDNTGAEASRQIVANHISALSFLTETGGVGIAYEAVNIILTAQRDNIQGRIIKPPIGTTLRTRVNLRN